MPHSLLLCCLICTYSLSYLQAKYVVIRMCLAGFTPKYRVNTTDHEELSVKLVLQHVSLYCHLLLCHEFRYTLAAYIIIRAIETDSPTYSHTNENKRIRFGKKFSQQDIGIATYLLIA